jgi:ADP-ribose pyrophosphatase
LYFVINSFIIITKDNQKSNTLLLKKHKIPFARNPMNSEYPAHPRPAVGAVVFFKKRILLVNRGKPPSQNQWSIPGGSVELGETLQEAAEREVHEETGLLIRAKTPIHTFDVIEYDDNGDIRFHYIIIDLEADFAGGDISPSDDAKDVRWVLESELKHLDVNRETLFLLKTCYNFGD